MRPACFAEKGQRARRAQAAAQARPKYKAKVWDHEGTLIYDGPCPIPEHVEALSLADIEAGRYNRYEVTEG